MTNKFWALAHDLAQSVLAEIAGHLPPAGGTPAARAESPAAGAAGFSQPAGGKRDKGYTVQNGVAVIPVSGPVTQRAVYSWWDGRALTAGQDAIGAALDAALADPAARAILLDVDSPGGTVAGTKELADSIAAAAKIKPMAAYANSLMASAAFWLGAATGRVYAPVTASLGSVGVIMVHFDFSKMNERWGVSCTYITGGKLKSAGNENEPLSGDAHALFQKQVSTLHEIFKADVVRGLGVTAPAESWAEGQTLLAGEAKSLGLVTDIVRDLSSAITKLRLEATMDYQTLAAQHPDLLAEIQGKARAEEKAAHSDAAKAAQESVLALVGIVAGDDMQAKISQLIAAEVTPEQLKAMSAIMPKAETPPQPAQDEEAKARAAILAGIQATMQQPVPGTPPAASSEAETAAAVERMAKM